MPKTTGGDFMLSKGTIYNLGSEIKDFGDRWNKCNFCTCSRTEELADCDNLQWRGEADA